MTEISGGQMVEAQNEFKHELMDAFSAAYKEMERHLSKLPSDPSDDRLDSLYCELRDIKNRANVLALDTIIGYTYALENIARAMCRRTLSTDSDVCECLQLGIDRLRDLHYRDVYGRKYAPLNEARILAQFNRVATASALEVKQCINELLILLGYGHAFDYAVHTQRPSKRLPEFKPILSPSSSDKQFLDLAFFRELSLQVDAQTPYWTDRSIHLYDWAQKLNRFAGNRVDYQQLAAATYTHDVGMCFVQATILNKTDELNEIERDEVQRHVAWGYDILIRMPGWEEAALIVLNHHERPDGEGYPNRLTGPLIHPGAKILAIVDAFFSMINGRADRPLKKSIIRAMAEINALAGVQFDSMWVEAFNGLIKEEINNGVL